jgi:ABC-type branched-subunit amino acid transport system ATPase component
VRLDAGRVELAGEDVTALPVERRVALGVVRTLQAPGVFAGLSVLENALVGAAPRGRCHGLLRTIAATPRQRGEAAALIATAAAALARVGLAARAHEPAETLSTTEQRLLMIATALAGDPAVVLLDEPSSGIGAAELPRLAEVVRELSERGAAVLIVEHNLRFVHSVADRVTVLDAGRAIATGTSAEVVLDPAVRSSYLGARA